MMASCLIGTNSLLSDLGRMLRLSCGHRSRLFLLALLWSLLHWSTLARADDPLQDQVAQFFPLPLDGILTLVNTDGSIHVYGWNEPRVRLAALRKAYTASRLQQIRIERSATPASLTVRTVVPKVRGIFADRSGTVDYSLTVPNSARLKLKMENGEIILEGLRGAGVDLDLVNGRVIALNCFAHVEAHSSTGVMEAFFDWWEELPATFDYALQRGRIGLRLPALAHFRVKAVTDNGRIHQGFGLPATTNAGTGQSLVGETGPNAPLSLSLRTGGGNISLDRIR